MPAAELLLPELPQSTHALPGSLPLNGSIDLNKKTRSIVASGLLVLTKIGCVRE
jgi:hypothetical protein